MTARVIAFINYKGGVAKTTTTYHVGCRPECGWNLVAGSPIT